RIGHLGESLFATYHRDLWQFVQPVAYGRLGLDLTLILPAVREQACEFHLLLVTHWPSRVPRHCYPSHHHDLPTEESRYLDKRWSREHPVNLDLPHDRFVPVCVGDHANP